MRCNLGNHDWIYLAEVMMIIDAWSYSTLNRGRGGGGDCKNKFDSNLSGMHPNLC